MEGWKREGIIVISIIITISLIIGVPGIMDSLQGSENDDIEVTTPPGFLVLPDFFRFYWALEFNQNLRPQEVAFKITDNEGRVKVGNQSLEISGITNEIIVNSTNGVFYEDSTDMNPHNETDNSILPFYLVYFDDNMNNKTDFGDFYLIHRGDKGGIAGPGDFFVLKNNKSGNTIIRIEFQY